MAHRPVLEATLQAALLGAVSNVLSQVMASYRGGTPLQVNWIPVFQFLFFSIISTPPNFIWQNYLESAFPARTAKAPPPKKSDEKLPPGPDHKQPLNVRNTLVKFTLDQTVGAAVNTLLFSIYIHSIHMAMPGVPRITSFTKAAAYWISPGVIDFSLVDLGLVLDAASSEFWTIVFAGIKLWPAVSLINYTFVKTVEGRSLVGCIAGLVWGVYMSTMAAK